ncbi:MAG: CDP-diacylglycerol--glycerol-3-phosphate 3-phosphatidyltransferase [Treponema sp.]|jgi:CDP-diacylglycerol--glycerol-3-phosphate 3-phosphatidyltransferase|nr:CDP-diacylglycerol--glycerol-3-phosphate 3-phosphatidyltransferase [Treponema sp.]
MTSADKLTSLRIVLAPVFFALYLLPGLFGGSAMPWTVPLLWVVFVISELSDMLDGQLARRLRQGSEFGKLFDPFADTLTQLTLFLCFVIDGILPSFFYLLVLYREYSVLFIRNLMLREGIVMGARIMGKLKTLTYVLAAALALLVASLSRLDRGLRLIAGLKLGAQVVFAVSVLISVLSFFDYLLVYRRARAGEAAADHQKISGKKC